MKVLILTTNTGGGHNSAAKAIKEEMYSRGIKCDIKNFLEFAPKLKEIFVVEGHTFTYRYLPKAYGFFYNIFDKDKKSGKKLYVEYGKYAKPLKEYIIQNHYDTVIAVHIFAGLMLSHARDHLNLNIQQYLVITDYTCSPGAANCNMDAWFVPKGLKSLFIEKGVDENKIVESGIPCTSHVYQQVDRCKVKSQLGFSQNDTIVFYCAGNTSVKKIQRFVNQFFRHENYCKLVILCGKNYSEMKDSDVVENIRLKLLEKTDEMVSWLHAVDVFISKAGGLTISEAASAGVPLILFDAVPGIESINRDYFLNHHFALSADGTDHLVSQTIRLLSNQVLKEEIITNQKAFFSESAVEIVVDTVIQHAEKQGEKDE